MNEKAQIVTLEAALERRRNDYGAFEATGMPWADVMRGARSRDSGEIEGSE